MLKIITLVREMYRLCELLRKSNIEMIFIFTGIKISEFNCLKLN